MGISYYQSFCVATYFPDSLPLLQRVPTGSNNPAQGTWGDFGNTPYSNPYWRGNGAMAGSLYNKVTPNSWYPASGLRLSSSGALSYVATNGYSWSASPYNDSSNARYLDFYSAGVNPASSYSRSFGFPVRCVQE